MIVRLILPDWVKETPGYDKNATPNTHDGDFSDEQIAAWQEQGYNAYYFPNYPSVYATDETGHGEFVNGALVDTFTAVFVDLDMKDYKSPVKDRAHDFETKDQFVEYLNEFELKPSRIVDSGGGIHAYWYVNDLDPMGWLRIQRRLRRRFTSDPAVAKLSQLMRIPNTINWKDPENPRLAAILEESGIEYTAEDLDKALPSLLPEDEDYCQAHYNKTYGLQEKLNVDEDLPAKWFKFAKKGTEPHDLFYTQQQDRSTSDFRLTALLHQGGFTKEEAISVIMNTNKASTRSGIHRYNYAADMVIKIWMSAEKPALASELLTKSVRDMLSANPDDETLKGTRFKCDPVFDATFHGFRLGQVMGLIGGVGTGKTAFGFNIFKGFALRNTGYIHLAVTLEQPELEYAQRWKKMCANDPQLLDCVHILGNYNDDGTYRHLSLEEIEDYVKVLEKATGKKVGAVMIDHIGVLKKETRNGENQGLIDICQYQKAMAINTNTFLIMQSQAPREKASIGDIELDKDAAYGTMFFEAFCDYVVTLWQPLKRVYDVEGCPLVTVFKFCKIRHKHVKKDQIKEDQRYPLLMNPDTDTFRMLTQNEMTSFDFFAKRATNLRNKDKKKEPGAVSAIDWTDKEDDNGQSGRNPIISRGLRSAKQSPRVSAKP